MGDYDKPPLGVMWLPLLGLLFYTGVVAAQYGSLQDGFVTYYTDAPSPAAAASPDDSLAPAPQAGGALLSGACGYGQLSLNDWPSNRVVALGPNSSIVSAIGANKLGCGQCIKATCTSSNCAANSSQGVELWIADGCGGCAANQLNVLRGTFLEYFGSTLGLGQVNVSYQQVNCDPPGNIQVKVVTAQPGSGGYIAIALLAVAGSGMLAGVDIKTSGSQTWAPMANGYGNVWEASAVGAAPLDVRITSQQGQVVVAMQAITNITTQTFPTDVQFSPLSPAPSPLRSSASSPGLTLPRLTPAPSISLPPSTLALGARITTPLYFPPPEVTALGSYAGIIWSYVQCFDGTPILNLTVSRTRCETQIFLRVSLLHSTVGAVTVPSSDGNTFPAYALHTYHYKAVRTRSSSQIYEIMDYSFFNLETGEFAELYEPVFASFTNTSFRGNTALTNLDTAEAIYPVYVSQTDLSGPANFDYTVLLPPGANENPTAAYLRALRVMFYYLSTLTLGNPGAGENLIPCSPGYPQLGPWADYVRSVLSALAPSDEIDGNLYMNIPLGQSFAFQDTSFLANNALIVGSVINITNELSGRDCGSRCRARNDPDAGLCSSWSWCGSISGCGDTSYQTCQLKNSSASMNTTSPSGFLNLQQGSNLRFTSGSLILPPPTMLSFTDVSVNSSSDTDGELTSAAINGGAQSPR